MEWRLVVSIAKALGRAHYGTIGCDRNSCRWSVLLALMLTAQTTLEMYDNSYIKKVCKKKGDKFSNMYDFGIVGNLLYFLNVGRRGPWYTALLPVRVPPIGNGKRFEKSGHGYVLDFDEDDRY
ncbi:hypothetical protein BGZ79_006234 [Entomortierella chlamydospora]|nr:hypothetical protein BGZ79_006234 [Entomortierella chlamydospora]